VDQFSGGRSQLCGSLGEEQAELTLQYKIEGRKHQKWPALFKFHLKQRNSVGLGIPER